MRQDLQFFVSACNQFYRFANNYLMFGLYPVEFILKELKAKITPRYLGAMITIPLSNGQTIPIYEKIVRSGSTYEVDYPFFKSHKRIFTNLEQALEAVLKYMEISSEDLKYRFEKPDFMGEYLMPEDYI